MLWTGLIFFCICLLQCCAAAAAVGAASDAVCSGLSPADWVIQMLWVFPNMIAAKNNDELIHAKTAFRDSIVGGLARNFTEIQIAVAEFEVNNCFDVHAGFPSHVDNLLPGLWQDPSVETSDEWPVLKTLLLSASQQHQVHWNLLPTTPFGNPVLRVVVLVTDVKSTSAAKPAPADEKTRWTTDACARIQDPFVKDVADAFLQRDIALFVIASPEVEENWKQIVDAMDGVQRDMIPWGKNVYEWTTGSVPALFQKLNALVVAREHNYVNIKCTPKSTAPLVAAVDSDDMPFPEDDPDASAAADLFRNGRVLERFSSVVVLVGVAILGCGSNF